jgi:hypothetical protein
MRDASRTALGGGGWWSGGADSAHAFHEVFAPPSTCQSLRAPPPPPPYEIGWWWSGWSAPLLHLCSTTRWSGGAGHCCYTCSTCAPPDGGAVERPNPLMGSPRANAPSVPKHCACASSATGARTGVTTLIRTRARCFAAGGALCVRGRGLSDLPQEISGSGAAQARGHIRRNLPDTEIPQLTRSRHDA